MDLKSAFSGYSSFGLYSLELLSFWSFRSTIKKKTDIKTNCRKIYHDNNYTIELKFELLLLLLNTRFNSYYLFLYSHDLKYWIS